MQPQITLRTLSRTGGRGVRKDAIARASSGGLSGLCLEYTQSVEEQPTTPIIVEIAIVAPKKQVSKHAVDRNTVKRRLRAAMATSEFNQLASEMFNKNLSGMRVLFVCRRPVLDAPFLLLKEQLKTCLQKLVGQLPKHGTH